MLRISVLGSLRTTLADRPLTPPLSVRAIELVVSLALAPGQPQQRSHLAGMLWPDSTESQARTNLRRELHSLRRVPVLADALIGPEGGALAWRDVPGCFLDLREFELRRADALARVQTGPPRSAEVVDAAADAITVYGGDLLPGLYDDWILDHRDRLHRQCVELCDVGASAVPASDGKRLAAGTELARRRIQLEPLEETGYQTLMILLAQAGDIGAAVMVYHRCAAVLGQELGIQPGPRTKAVMEGLLPPAPSRSGSRPGGEVPAPAPGPPATAALSTSEFRERSAGGSPLVGRERELAQLGRAWQGAEEGRAGVVVVSGDAGVGKSRLVAELAAGVRARSGITAWARCFAGSGRLALAPVASWLRSAELRPFVESIANGWHGEVGRLLALPGAGPEMQSHTPVASDDGRPVHPMVDGWQRHRFFEGLAQAMLASGRPTLLILDDLQWCDEETINWLEFLLNRGGAIPLLVAATARTGEGNSRSAVPGALRAYLPAGGVQDISLPPLDLAGTTRLAESLADRALTSREQQLLYDASGGYPLYIVEAARALPAVAESGAFSVPAQAGALSVPAEPGALSVPAAARALPTSEGISAILDSRLGQASDEAREIAELASAVGREFGLDLLVAASGQEEQAVVRAVDELWRHGILRQQSGGYDFSHDLLRTAAYARISPPRRWFFHRRIAHSLELLHAERLDGVAAQVATQFELAGAPDRALEYYERAGDLSTRLFANAQALSDYQQCLDLLAGMSQGPERDSRELEILRKMPAPLTALRGYAHPQLRSILEHIVELSGQLERRDVQLTGLIGLFAATFVQGEMELAHRIGQRSLVLATRFPQLEGQAHFAYAGTAVSLGRPLEAVQHFELASALSPDSYSYILGTRIEVHARAWCAHAYWLTGERSRASEAAAEAVELARASHHPYSLAVALAYAAVLHQIQCADDEPLAVAQHDGRPAVAVATFAAEARELRQICERYDFAYYGHWGQILEGWARGGAAGLEDVRKGIGNLRTSGSFARMPYWLSLEADLLQEDGAARAVLAAAEAAAYQRDDLWWLPEILRKRAALEEQPAATALLQRARQLAIDQQSPALARRVPSS